MLRSQATRLERTLRTSDLLVAAGVALFVFRLRGAAPAGDNSALLTLAVAATLAYPMTLNGLGLYSSQRREGLGRLLGRFVVGGALVAAALVVTVFALGRAEWSSMAASLAFG